MQLESFEINTSINFKMPVDILETGEWKKFFFTQKIPQQLLPTLYICFWRIKTLNYTLYAYTGYDGIG